MSRPKFALFLALALAAAAPAASGAAPKPAWKAGDVVVVKREGVRLMRAARFYGKPCAERVAPGERVRIAERGSRAPSSTARTTSSTSSSGRW